MMTLGNKLSLLFPFPLFRSTLNRICLLSLHAGASQEVQLENLPATQETPVLFLGWEHALGEGIQYSSLVGYSPWGRKESDMMEQLSVA